ncbi:MAG: response regulator transcription factor [Candidatus Dormibacteraceae bacterium]
MNTGTRILVAEDEEPLRRLLGVYLGRAGFDVVAARTGTEALDALRGGGLDAAIIDVMLPELDGFEVVRRIRATSSIPIIFLTARGEEASRVAGLELGADDYVVKPFFAEEVVARVRAQLRRVRGFEEKASVLRTGHLEVDLATRRCRLDASEVELSRREFDLLAAFLERPGQVFSRSQLLETAWGTQYLTAKTVDVHIASLRRKLGEALRITALRGIGYRLEPSSE